MDSQNPSLETLQDIKRMMERSSRFISLSGLSGLSAGICALIGAYVAHGWINDFNEQKIDQDSLRWKLVILAFVVLGLALVSSLYFTLRKAKQNKVSVWDHSSKKLLINLAIPLATGAAFIAGLIYHDEGRLVAAATLVFYGLALVNASKYTLRDIRYVGILEILLGIVSMYYAENGLYFWALGFGVIHIIYGLFMWWKYDKK
jgi:asparagine N-glycosylation enzyme membrane subunit Stt3